MSGIQTHDRRLEGQDASQSARAAGCSFDLDEFFISKFFSLMLFQSVIQVLFISSVISIFSICTYIFCINVIHHTTSQC